MLGPDRRRSGPWHWDDFDNVIIDLHQNWQWVSFRRVFTVNYREVVNEPELTGVQVAARASAFTVLIECQG